MERIEFTQAMASTIRSLREKQGLSQYDLAEKAGIPRASIKRLECFEVKSIKVEDMKRIDAVLDSPAMKTKTLAKAKNGHKKPKKKAPRPRKLAIQNMIPLGTLGKNGKIRRFEVIFDEPTTVDVLLQHNIFTKLGHSSFEGKPCGVECSNLQAKKGIPRGEPIVLAYLFV